MKQVFSDGVGRDKVSFAQVMGVISESSLLVVVVVVGG